MTATSVTPGTIGVSGGIDITIAGNGFGTSTEGVSVIIDSQSCVVKEVSMTSIVCEAPALTAGTLNVQVIASTIKYNSINVSPYMAYITTRCLLCPKNVKAMLICYAIKF